MRNSIDTADSDYPDPSASHILTNFGDYRMKKGAVEKLVAFNDHILLFSSKSHPEIYGCRIEFD